MCLNICTSKVSKISYLTGNWGKNSNVGFLRSSKYGNAEIILASVLWCFKCHGISRKVSWHIPNCCLIYCILDLNCSVVWRHSHWRSKIWCFVLTVSPFIVIQIVFMGVVQTQCKDLALFPNCVCLIHLSSQTF